jgi:hypothetical protein
VVASVSLMKLTAPLGSVGPMSTVNVPSGLTTRPWSSSRLSLLTAVEPVMASVAIASASVPLPSVPVSSYVAPGARPAVAW